MPRTTWILSVRTLSECLVTPGDSVRRTTLASTLGPPPSMQWTSRAAQEHVVTEKC